MDATAKKKRQLHTAQFFFFLYIFGNWVVQSMFLGSIFALTWTLGYLGVPGLSEFATKMLHSALEGGLLYLYVLPSAVVMMLFGAYFYFKAVWDGTLRYNSSVKRVLAILHTLILLHLFSRMAGIKGLMETPVKMLLFDGVPQVTAFESDAIPLQLSYFFITLLIMVIFSYHILSFAKRRKRPGDTLDWMLILTMGVSIAATVFWEMRTLGATEEVMPFSLALLGTIHLDVAFSVGVPFLFLVAFFIYYRRSSRTESNE